MIREVAKSQWVRLYNVLVICPWMMYLSRKYNMKGWERGFMVWAQVGTLLFNLRNLIKDRETPQQPYGRIPLALSTVYDHPEAKRREMKAVQKLRWFDLLVYGPACVVIASRHKMTFSEEVFLRYTGYSTIGLNGANYLANKKGLQQ